MVALKVYEKVVPKVDEMVATKGATRVDQLEHAEADK